MPEARCCATRRDPFGRAPTMPLTRDEMRGKVQTVLGLIDPAELGST